MPGRHESANKRSFYLSLATSTLRGVILVVLIVLGVIGLTKLFPQNASLGVTPGATHTSTTPPSTSPSPSGSTTPHRKARPKSQVTILVLNATSQLGLATQVNQSLQADGYKTKTPGNYTPKLATTVIYYQADSLPEAQRLLRQRFPSAELKPAPATLASDIDIEVVLGADQLQG